MNTPLHQQSWSEFQQLWQPRTRVALIVCVIVVFASQVTSLVLTERFRFAGLFLLVALLHFLYYRRLLEPVKSSRSSSRRIVLFPGYLLLLGIVVWIAGSILLSLPIVTLGCVYVIGWFIAKRCDRANWPQLAQPWLLLHLLCVSKWLDWSRIASLQSFASARLDSWGIYHRIEGDRLTLIDRALEISLDSNVFLSDYALVGLTLCFLTLTRSSVLLTIIAIGVAGLVSTTLIAQRILLGGLNIWLDWKLDETALNLVLQGAVFLLSLGFVAGASSLLWLTLSPISLRLGGTSSICRLSRMWNRISEPQLSELMTG